MMILSCPQMAGLAGRIHGLLPGSRRCEIQWGSFPDGFPNLRVLDVESLRGQHVAFLASLDTPAEIFRQLSVIYELPRYALRSFQLALPFFPTGTMERVDEDGQIATAHTLARMLSLIPMSMAGPAQLIIFDIHALQERFYFSPQVVPRLETAMGLVAERLRSLDKDLETAVAFPDEGAWKRFGRLLAEFPQILCRKVRKGPSGRQVVLEEGEPRGRRVVIVDDLVQSGGTLLACKQALEQAGAAQVGAAATHGVFPGESWRRLAEAGFFRFWFTDSLPAQAEALDGTGPFEVLSLDRTLAGLLSAGELWSPDGHAGVPPL